MHDRLTWFCVTCGLRQGEAPRCVACEAEDMVELRDPEHAAPYVRLASVRNVALHEQRYLQRAPSVRKAPLSFALGSAATLGLSIGVPVAAGWPVAGALLVAGSFAGGGLLGLGLSRLMPRWLLGVHQKRELERELDALAAASPTVQVVRRPPPTAEQHVWEGELAGTPEPSPFFSNAVLAARVVGRFGPLDVDDAWLAPGPLRVVPSPAAHGPPRVEVELDPGAGLWLDAEAVAEPLGSTPALERYFASRGGRRGLDAGSGLALSVALFPLGARVRLAGRPARRTVSDGYRGARDVLTLLPPHVLTLVA